MVAIANTVHSHSLPVCSVASTLNFASPKAPDSGAVFSPGALTAAATWTLET